MIPILYESTETGFGSNGLGRLHDCISAVCSEERNGLFELDFEYPVDGIHFDLIQCGRIVCVTHDETKTVQPFDIVSYSRPINGVVTFHCVHVSYRQTAMTVSGTNINSLADAFTMLGTASPSNPFMYWTNKTSTGFLASADGIPHSVRSILGGMEGSILDAYGGEYEWDTWNVKLWAARGSQKSFTIRYGVNLTDYEEEIDYSDTYTACIPYWTGQDENNNDIVIQGSMQTTSYPSFNGRTRCIPLDVTDKFENKPTVAQVEAQGLSYINTNQTYLPAQNIKVDFVRISDSPEYAQFASLQQCNLCDIINVEFPKYGMSGQFKIVKTEYDVLRERYNTLELGTLATTLSEALGISQESSTKFAETPTVIEAGGDSNISLTANTMTNIPLVDTNLLYNNTNDVSLDTTLHGLKIKTTGIYKVQASVYFAAPATATAALGCFIRKSTNGGDYSSATEIQGTTNSKGGAYDITVHSPIKLFQFSENDVIYLVARSSGGTATAQGANSSTFLYIEKV